MLGPLTQRLGEALSRIGSAARVDERRLEETWRAVRVALLEADVALPVVRDFIAALKMKAAAGDLASRVQPGRALLGMVHAELQALLGGVHAPLDLAAPRPLIVLVAGLQGSGKTTSCGKLARHLRVREKLKVGLAGCDVQRPAALEQLHRLAAESGAVWLECAGAREAAARAQAAVEEARRSQLDVVLVDSAGRLHVEAAMMAELRELHAITAPHETLFVVDALGGQDALVAARAFHEAVPLTGLVLTKADGDARGGALLSARVVTGCPVKFVGSGEKLDAFQAFHPERFASRLLGMGDIQTLCEEVEDKTERAESVRLARQIGRGRGLTLDDLLRQLEQMGRLGGIAGLLDKLPGFAQVPPAALGAADPEREVRRMKAVIQSMTPAERRRPEIIRGSRKRRIAAGAGATVQDVNRVLKQHQQMAGMMKQLKGRKGQRLLAGLGRNGASGLGKGC